MLLIQMLRRAMHHLRRPFIQRLITLVVSTLLAMGLGYTTIVMALPQAGHAVASSASALPSHPVFAVRLGHPFTPANGQGHIERRQP